MSLRPSIHVYGDPDPASRVRTAPLPRRVIPVRDCLLDLVLVEHTVEPPPLYPLQVGSRLWLALWTKREALARW